MSLAICSLEGICFDNTVEMSGMSSENMVDESEPFFQHILSEFSHLRFLPLPGLASACFHANSSTPSFQELSSCLDADSTPTIRLNYLVNKTLNTCFRPSVLAYLDDIVEKWQTIQKLLLLNAAAPYDLDT